MNTQEIKNLISKFNDGNSVITKLDSIVIVNLDWLTSRDYQAQGINEFLYTIGQYKNLIIVFLIRDGVNCWLTGLKSVIEKVVTDLELTSDSCFIYGYNDLQIANTTYIKMDVVQMWISQVYKNIQNLPLSTATFDKKFAALFGRHDMFRLKISKQLHEKYKQYSTLSYMSDKAWWNPRFCELFENDKKWHNLNCPILLDFDQPTGWVPYQKSLEHIDKHYQTYFIEIVAETDPHTNKFFTEKTVKNFYLGKPFILWSGPDSLETLKELGFKTFSPWINESYDRISNTYDRFNAILIEIDRIASLPIANLQQMHAEMEQIFAHNRENFLKFV